MRHAVAEMEILLLDVCDVVGNGACPGVSIVHEAWNRDLLDAGELLHIEGPKAKAHAAKILFIIVSEDRAPGRICFNLECFRNLVPDLQHSLMRLW